MAGRSKKCSPKGVRAGSESVWSPDGELVAGPMLTVSWETASAMPGRVGIRNGCSRKMSSTLKSFAVAPIEVGAADGSLPQV